MNRDRNNRVTPVRVRRRDRGGLRRATAGQSLVVAVVVLFLLLFIGGIFVILIANNLRSAQRVANVGSAGGFSEAGIRYLDEQLTNSAEGADWRPIPALSNNAQDPDYFWLKPYDPTTGEGGFTRVTFGGPTPSQGNLGGRALVRITYQPNLTDPTSKYLKLESVGRTGFVDPTDPTTFGNSERAGLRRELVAYKAIGITDYVRSVWNKDNKPVVSALGAPIRVFDSPNATGNRTGAAPTLRDIPAVYRGPIRVQSNVTFYGENNFFLNSLRNDALEITGRIALNNVPSTTTAPAATDPSRGALFVNGATTAVPLFPSESPAFDTYSGIVRDGLTDPDSKGRPRSISRIAPPLIDAAIGQNNLTRFRLLTRNSAPLAPRFTTDNPIPNTTDPDFAAARGWGSGMYIPNRNDVQRESSTLTGVYSLRSDWLQPGRSGRQTVTYWKGDFSYVPPAVTIWLTPRYIIVTRSQDLGAQGRARTYIFAPDGTPIASSTSAPTTIIRYTKATEPKPTAGLSVPDPLKFEGYPAELNADGVVGTADDNYYSGDFVLFAEGNVRIRGVVGGVDPETQKAFLRHLTVVSNGTIYVDGNLLRDNITPTMASSSPTLAAIQGRSSIALLAKDYVCVNTTQFLNPSDAEWIAEGQNGGPPYSVRLDNRPGNQQFPFRLTLGPQDNINTPPVYAQPTPPAGVEPLSIFFRHGAEFTQGSSSGGQEASIINLFVNPLAATAPTDYFAFPLTPGYAPYQHPITAAGYINEVFTLDPNQLYPAKTTPFTTTPASALGLDNVLAINYDLTSRAAYKFSRVGVAPLDIRIEAFMYAQEGSFFIIPGPWFNPDPNDTYANYFADDPANPGTPRNRRASAETFPKFPFYREPMDIRVTLFGTIAENVTAQIGDQGAWMEKWGWIPRYYGSTGLPTDAAGSTAAAGTATVHGPAGALAQLNGNGLLFDFDDRAVLPYAKLANGNPDYTQPIRSDAYGRVLPIAPRMPVAQGLLYFGESPIR